MSNVFEPSRRHLLSAALLFPMVGARAVGNLTVAEVWKDPSCGCCKDWITHMQQAGFELRVHETGNTAARVKFGIPEKYGSCHTARIGGYTIEGHVPARDIQRLLQEKPKAVGLAVPGMVVGSPGMDGPQYGTRKDPYDVILVMADGSSTVYKSYR